LTFGLVFNIIRGVLRVGKRPRVHRVFANLKLWLAGTHRFVSKKHLQNYLVVLTELRTYRGFVKPRKSVYPNLEDL
jgi:hypothetical protein